MLSYLRKSKLAANFILMIFAFSVIGVTPGAAPAQEQYPAVARLSFVSGPVTYSRGDDPDEWDDAIENVPLTIGDRIYAPEKGQAEVQLSSGNFVRLAPRSYLSTLNLSDDVKQFYLGEGAASFIIKRLQPDEVIEIDTPNVSVTLEEPGQYRVAVDDDGNSRVTVRRGRVTVAASGRQIAVENSEIRVYGIDSPRYEIVGLPAIDAFDRWVSERNDRFERSYSDAYRYASEDIVGAEDLGEYGRWEEIPEYGYAWTPSRVAAGWTPFSDGRWYWQDPWGWSWISNERWGWATSHYGRWTPHRSRWYWVPVRPRTRVRYAPAVVEFVRVRDHVGWFPLHPRDRQIPWWQRRDRFERNVTYVNRTYVTVVNQNTFITARPVNKYLVRDSVIVRDARSARFSESLPIPSRSSLRIVSENGGRRGHRPSDKIVNRAAVIRTAVPASPRAFQEKLPEIQKNQGKAVEFARTLAATRDERATGRVRVRAAAETGRGDFAPRNPDATSGPASQPLTQARGKKLAAGGESAANNAEKADRAQKTPGQPDPSKATASRPESPRQEPDRERQREEKQTLERERQAQQQQEIERKKQAQEEERKAQAQKQQQERENRQQSQERQAQEQKQRELERRQAQQKQQEERKAQPQKQPAQERQTPQQRLEELERRQAQQQEEERKTQAQQNLQEQERREQVRQQQLQERQAQQQRQQEQARQQHQEQEQARQAQQQQEQARREQSRQQQAQERQAREQQRQQDLVRQQQQQQQREQERNAQAQRQEQARAQQLLRQQQAQEQRQAQQAQRQQEQERRQSGPQPQQERPVPQAPPRPPTGQF